MATFRRVRHQRVIGGVQLALRICLPRSHATADYGLLYAIVDQMLYRLPGSRRPRASPPSRASIGAPANRNTIESLLGGRAHVRGLCRSAPRRHLGVGFAYTGISSEIRQSREGDRQPGHRQPRGADRGELLPRRSCRASTSSPTSSTSGTRAATCPIPTIRRKAVPNAAVLGPAHDDQLLSAQAQSAPLARLETACMAPGSAPRLALLACRFMSDHDGRHTHRRTDGRRQVRPGPAAWPSAWAASSSTPTPCRSIASCAFSPRARRRRRRRVSRTRSMASSAGSERLLGRALRRRRRARAHEARGKGLRPIIVGGTGLYFKALTEGLSPMPEVPEEIRARWRDEAAKARAGRAARASCARRDPAMAARPGTGRHAADRARAGGARCLGRVAAREWQQRPREPVLDAAETVRIVVAPERVELYRAHRARFDGHDGSRRARGGAATRGLGLDPALPDHERAGRASAAGAS